MAVFRDARKSLVKEIEAYARATPNRQWANVICILNKGYFLRHLVERLIAAGVPEALPLEQQLAGLP